MKTIKNPLMSARQRKKGFTLTEIAIVLGIIGLILGAIWSAAASVYNNQRIAHANTAVLQIAQGVRQLYANTSTIDAALAGTDITALVTSAGMTPSDLGTNDPLTGPFPGGSTAVYDTKDNVGFVVEMTGVTAQQCISLLTAVGGQSRDPGLYEAAGVTGGALGTDPAASVTTAGKTTPPIAATVTATTATVAYANGVGGCGKTPNAVYFGFTVK